MPIISALKHIIGAVKGGGIDWSSYWTTRTPSAPTITVSGTTVTLGWTNAAEDIDGHSIRRSTDHVTYTEIDTVAVGTNTYEDTITAGGVYYYDIRAYKGSNYSDPIYTNTILYGLTAYWKLDETSGTRADSVGNSHLWEANTVTYAAGKAGNCAEFTSANQEYLWIDDNAALSIGQTSFEIAMWVKLKSDALMRIVSKDEGSTYREYAIDYDNVSKRFRFYGWFGAGAGTIKIVSATTFGQPQLNTWYFLNVYFDSAAQTAGISVNGGAFDTVATASPICVNGASYFYLGAYAPTSTLANAMMDEVGFWKGRVLSTAERALLAAADTYPFDGRTVTATVPDIDKTIVLTRYAGNPIIENGADGAFDDTDCAGVQVFYDTPNSRWVMNYSGYDGAQWRTGLAYSDDLLTWTKEATNPVLSPVGTQEGYIAANGSIVYLDGTYYLIYQGGTTVTFLYLATSPDLLNWTRVPGVGENYVLSTGGGDPELRLLADNTFELFVINGSKVPLRYTSPDCITWTQDTGFTFPLLTTGGQSPIKLTSLGDSVYGMAFDRDVATFTRHLFYAVTYDNGRTWLYRGKILAATGTGWEDTQTCDSSLVIHNGVLYVFYFGSTEAGGSEGMMAQIGVATMTL